MTKNDLICFFSILERKELIGLQALIAKAAVERLDERIFVDFPSARSPASPGCHRPTCLKPRDEFTTVVPRVRLSCASDLPYGDLLKKA